MRVIAAVLVCAFGATADDLPRHGMIGLTVGQGQAVERVTAGGAGAAAGIQVGDVIQSLDGIAIGTTDQFVRGVARRLAGATVQVGLLRGGETLVRAAVLKPRPYETSPYAEVLYRSVMVRGARRRVIVTIPNRAGPHGVGPMPAVLLMHGLGCYSLDGTDRQNGYGRVIGELEQRGFVTMRVEKTGEGDSEGPGCQDLSATPALEAEGYVAGLRALKQYDFVDPAKVFVFAHSLGPVIGSLAITEEPVRGFIAVETVGTSWFEYDVERTRVQEALSGEDPEAVDRAVREYEACSHRFFVEKLRPEELLKDAACKAVMAPLASVPYTYMQAVGDISLGKQWKGAKFPVLVVYGTASPVTTAHQNRYLAEIINRYHPGQATYVEVPGMGHDLGRYETQKDYMQRAGSAAQHPFHMGLMEEMMSWIDGVLGDNGR
jgi:pimeloyl-ACP methyl ester carboxylesterase